MSESAHSAMIGEGLRRAPARSAPARAASAANALAGFGLFILMLSLQPFAGVPNAAAPGESTGNIVNQIGYFGLGIAFLAAMLTLTQRAVLARLGFGSWAIVFGIAALSAAQSLDPTASLRVSCSPPSS